MDGRSGHTQTRTFLETGQKHTPTHTHKVHTHTQQEYKPLFLLLILQTQL